MTTTHPITADQLAVRWTEFWNGALDSATDLVAGDFVVRFAAPVRSAADALRGPAALAAFVGEFRAARPGLRYVLDSAAVGGLDDAGTGSFAVRWHAENPDHGGIDILEAVAGRLVRVWSVTGSDLFTLD